MISLDKKLKNLKHKELVAFDFDETIVACNSDTWVHQLAPEGKIPDDLRYRHGQDWTKHVQSVFAFLHGKRVREQDYRDCLAKMPSVPGMVDKLIETLKNQLDKYDLIIISDSNSFFINSYLKSKNLDSVFSAILTNPAEFNDNGELMLNEFHNQDYCKLSSRNLCKGEALKNYIGKMMLANNTVYTCVNYIGDGENDFCPSSKLSNRDRIFPREGYSLSRLCAKLKFNANDVCSIEDTKNLPELKASVIPWSDGEDILNVITGIHTPV